MAVRYVLANFLTGRTITEVPVTSGATWALALDKADALSCTIDFRDRGVQALDPRSITEPHKTILLAVTDDDVVLAWGVIDPKRSWNDTNKQLTVNASGAWAYWDRCLIGTSALRTSDIIVNNAPNTALDRTFSNLDLATIGKRLMQDRLSWPGATMPFTFFADRTGSRQMSYAVADYKMIGSALTDLVERDNGPDFEFAATLNSDGLGYSYPVRAGTEAAPFLGSFVGTWSTAGDASPISGLTIDDDFGDFAVATWTKSQGTTAAGVQVTLGARVLNDALRIGGGYPPEDYVDTSHSDVSVQQTLNDYAAEASVYASKYQRSLSFNVASYFPDGTPTTPALGQYRPGDYVDLDFDGHVYLGTQTLRVRITGVSGDVEGLTTKVSAQVVS